MKVIIAVAAQSEMKAKTAHSIGCNIIKNPCVKDFALRQGGDIVSARAQLAQIALDQNATHILFVDSDMMFPPETLGKLLAHNLDIVGVEYNKRTWPLEPVQMPLEKDGAKKDSIYKCDYVGTGLLLINTNVFKKISKPWFNFGRKEQKIVIGEDVWFCRSARDAGYDVWCDPTINVFHIGDFAY